MLSGVCGCASLMGMIVLPYLGPAAARRGAGAPCPGAGEAACAAQRAVWSAKPSVDPLESLGLVGEQRSRSRQGRAKRLAAHRAG